MAILKAPPRQPKNASIQLRVEEELKFKLDRYAEFIGANTSYVVSEALRFLFQKDQEFKHWLAQYKQDNRDRPSREPAAHSSSDAKVMANQG